jgi:exopolysaccharide biosynthesis protein
MEFLVGGTPLLLREGEIIRDFGPEKVPENFVNQRHPRTAVGIRADGTWVFVVVDGRRPTISVGMTLSELAQLMKSLGCKDALNLDGGGSSTLYLYGQVVNIPSDLAGERPVSDAILVMPK